MTPLARLIKLAAWLSLVVALGLIAYLLWSGSEGDLSGTTLYSSASQIDLFQ